jgi:tetratricopeptide (TPR) repeat protein
VGAKVARRIAAGLGAALMAVAPMARGEPLASAEAERTALVEGLQAQFEVALIRERKLADDRETQAIAVLEARLRQARAAAIAEKGDARAALEGLAEARDAYAKLAGQLSARDDTDKGEIRDYGAAIRTVTAQATPALAAALQRFADGDRLGAWPQIIAEAAKVDATPGATDVSRAALARQLAALRNQMRIRGEASTADVLALWTKAGELDPGYAPAELARARLASELRDPALTKAAAQQALAVAATDGQRGQALLLLAQTAADERDFATAEKDYGQAQDLFQRLVDTDGGEQSRSSLADTLAGEGEMETTEGAFAKARSNLASALAFRRKNAQDNPADPLAQSRLTNSLEKVGELDLKIGDLTGARAALQEGLGIRQGILRGDPTNADDQFYLTAFLRRLGDVAKRERDYTEAKASYGEALRALQQLAAANPSSGHLAEALGGSYFELGAADFELGDIKDAIANFQASLGIRKALGAADPTNADIQDYILITLWRLARLPGGGVAWSDVAGQYTAVKQAGHLADDDEKVLASLKEHHMATGL